MNCWFRNGVKCAMLTGHCQRLSEKKLLRFPYSLLATRVTASRTQALKPSCPELQLTLLESLPKTDRLKALAGFPWFKPGWMNPASSATLDHKLPNSSLLFPSVFSYLARWLNHFINHSKKLESEIILWLCLRYWAHLCSFPLIRICARE